MGADAECAEPLWSCERRCGRTPKEKELEATGDEEVVESDGSSAHKADASSADARAALESAEVRCCKSSRRSGRTGRARTKCHTIRAQNVPM